MGNTNGRPYLSVVTNKRHHATTVLDITQVLLVGDGGRGRGRVGVVVGGLITKCSGREKWLN